MTTLLISLRNTAISGFFFLLPVVVIFIILTKVWTALASVGGNLAAMFGMKSIMGLGGANVLTGLLTTAATADAQQHAAAAFRNWSTPAVATLLSVTANRRGLPRHSCGYFWPVAAQLRL